MELIYSGKKYNYQIKGHLGGLLNLMNFNIDPKGSIAMKLSRHPIFESDLGFIIKLMRKNLLAAKEQNMQNIEFVKELQINKKSALLFTAEFPENKGFYGHKIYIYLDKDLFLPVKFDVYDWNNKLIGAYSFANLKINIGMTYLDFDIDNELYGF
jgi:hypothetical protein